MHFEFLVEEESAEAALNSLIPKILGPGVSFAIRRFQGKQSLLAALPQRLRGYRIRYDSGQISDWRIVVLIDEDRENCHDLKQQMEEIATNERLITWTATPDKTSFQVLNRIVVEELEAWFFGDISALRRAYPKIPASLAQKEKYRDPDAITGGTWETLERLLKSKNYYKTGLPKIAVARLIACEMEPDDNRSKSFQVFRDALRQAVS